MQLKLRSQQRRLTILFAVLVAAAGATLSTVGAQKAWALCSNHGCDWGEPQSSGCAATATTQQGASFRVYGYDVGYVHARYSSGCKSQWTRVGYNPDPSPYEHIPGATLNTVAIYGNGYNVTGPGGGGYHDWWGKMVGAATQQYTSRGVLLYSNSTYGAECYA